MEIFNMKRKYIIPIIMACLTIVLASCNNENNVTLLSNIKVSSSYVSIPVEGGEDTIVVNATGKWNIEKVTSKTDNVKWLNIEKQTDKQGNNLLIFKAPKTLSARSAQVRIHCERETQYINVIQGVAKAENVTCKDVIAGPDSKTYRVKGVVTKIINTTYGNWILKDATGEILIYGTLDKKGNPKNFTSLDIEEGDEVTVEGPKKTYKSTVELVEVSVIKIDKSLIKVDSILNDTIPVKGGETSVYLTCKAQGVSVEIPTEAKTWLSISAIQTKANNTVVKFIANSNQGGERTTKIVFHTTDGKKNYTAQTTIVQAGSIVQCPISNFLSAPVSDTQYRITGIVTNIKNTQYGNLYIKDFSGEVFVYGIANFAKQGIKQGDIVTLIGKRGEHKGTKQMVKAQVEKLTSVTPITIEEVLKKADSKTTYYMVTGTIKEIKNATYGNVTLKDGNSEIYLYGMYPGYGATGDSRKGLISKLNLKVGDEVTVIACKGSYNKAPQLTNGMYYKHQSK